MLYPQLVTIKLPFQPITTLLLVVAIKEEESQKTKKELLILWTDYFKPEHLATYPDLHATFWKAAKLCSACKVNIDLNKAEELLAAVQKMNSMFWSSKGRSDSWVTAS